MKAEEHFLEIVRNNIIRYRNKIKITQLELAERTGLEVSHIGKFESTNHNHTLKTIFKLAAGLEIEPWQLLKKGNHNGNHFNTTKI
jgi:transcriptional regulator with XRE-family HTH domain